MRNSTLVKCLLVIILYVMSYSTRAETIEVVVFNLKNNVTSQQVTSAAKQMLGTISGWDGFISRELVKVSSEKWIDIVHWKSLEAARSAQEKALKSDVCLAFFSLIDEKQQQFYHGEIVLKQ